MKAVIVCTSVSHGNTKRVADVMGRVLGAPVVDPDEVDTAELAECDLVGFGSGIFTMDFHSRLRHFVESLPDGEWRAAFVFATSGLPEPRFRPYTRRLGRLLERKGFEVTEPFLCRGFDTYLPFRLVGGIRKGRPGPSELDAARAFAERLSTRMEHRSCPPSA
ncbi:flavodoxin family protein [Amycolatopsis sp. NPDC059021]|uniref:flavodoxin family protein n=1 Tax=Amycolatopsis sp. NPDC059021 TaxID=3346704 RepID=UPI003671AD2C